MQTCRLMNERAELEFASNNSLSLSLSSFCHGRLLGPASSKWGPSEVGAIQLAGASWSAVMNTIRVCAAQSLGAGGARAGERASGPIRWLGAPLRAADHGQRGGLRKLGFHWILGARGGGRMRRRAIGHNRKHQAGAGRADVAQLL